MKLALINASPRGKNSNSSKLLTYLTRELPASVEKVYGYAVKAENQPEAIETIKACDYFVFAFPLYTDAMPGIAKKFFENMMEKKEYFTGKPVMFLIHSGFPEAIQSRALERYLKHFTKLMGMKDMGVIIIGNSEGLRFNAKQDTSKRALALTALGHKISAMQPLTEEECKLPGHMEVMPKAVLAIFKVIAPLTDAGWYGMMKKNGVFEKRFDRPYQ